MAKAPASKTAAEQYAAGTAAFKETVEKAIAGLTDGGGDAKKNLDAVVASLAAAAKGAETLSTQAMAYSKSTLEAQVAAAQALATSKSIPEAVEKQTAFAKSALEAYMAAMGEMSETLAASMKASFKPLGERVSATVANIKPPKL